jgi:hypothetical protein
MMFRLRSGLSFCLVGDQPVFLDLVRDRYFLLRPQLADAFRRICEGQSDDEADGQLLLRSALIEPANASSVIKPVRTPEARRKSPAMMTGRCSALEVAVALGTEWNVRRQIRRGHLPALVCRLKELKVRLPIAKTLDDALTSRTIRSFELAKFARSPADLCLSRSTALSLRLSRLGLGADLVMGVRLIPFTAHSWVQIGDTVLNDSPEEVSRYTPIFVA